jgi:hypothetical protein
MCANKSPLLSLLAILAGVACSASGPGGGGQMIKTVVLSPSTSDLPAGWSVHDLRDVVQRAADHWSYPNVPCGVRVVVGEPRAEWRAVRDGTNLVAVRGRSWCHNGKCGPTTTFPFRSMGMTTTYPAGATGGAVTEADVEVNGVFFQFSDVTDRGAASPAKRPLRLESVLMHEIGHVLGLGDVCGAIRMQSGRPVTASCSSEDQQRVMFAAGRQESLSPGDVAELCGIYPPQEGVLVEAGAGGFAP